MRKHTPTQQMLHFPFISRALQHCSKLSALSSGDRYASTRTVGAAAVVGLAGGALEGAAATATGGLGVDRMWLLIGSCIWINWMLLKCIII